MLHCVGKIDNLVGILPRSAIVYAHKIIKHINEEEQKLVGQKKFQVGYDKIVKPQIQEGKANQF